MGIDATKSIEERNAAAKDELDKRGRGIEELSRTMREGRAEASWGSLCDEMSQIFREARTTLSWVDDRGDEETGWKEDLEKEDRWKEETIKSLSHQAPSSCYSA